MYVGAYFCLHIYIHDVYAETHTFFFTQTLEWLKYKGLSFPGPWAISLGVSFPQLPQVPDVVSAHPSHHRKWESGQEIPSRAKGLSENVTCPDTAVDWSLWIP